MSRKTHLFELKFLGYVKDCVVSNWTNFQAKVSCFDCPHHTLWTASKLNKMPITREKRPKSTNPLGFFLYTINPSDEQNMGSTKRISWLSSLVSDI